MTISRGLVSTMPMRKRHRGFRRPFAEPRRVPPPCALAFRLLRATILTLLASALIAAPSAGGAESQRPADAAPPAGPASVPGPGQMNNLAVITIEGEINAVTSTSFKRRLDEAVNEGADGVVVEIDSPGGEVGAFLEICAEIKKSPLYTIAWVNDMAYSGGAIIALACDEMVLATNATLGDAAMIQLGIDLEKQQFGLLQMESTEREKLIVPLITEVVDSAVQNGYDEVLVVGFVQLGVETWMVERKRDGERFFLSEREYKDLFGREPPRGKLLVPSAQSVVSSQSEFHDDSLDQPTDLSPDPEFDADPWERATSGILGENTKQELRTSAFVSQSTRPDFREADPDDFTYLGYATDGKSLLTLKEHQLRQFGFTPYDQAIDTDAQLKNYVGATNLARLDQTWSESLVAFMTQGASGLIIRGLLIVVFLLALFIEFTMPGIGVAGVVAVVALCGLIIPPMMIGASTWWALAAILVGVALLLLEILVFPGFGVPGVTGLALLMVGLVGTFAQTGEMFPGAGRGGQNELAWAVSTVLLALFAAGVGMFFVMKYTRSIPIANKLVLFDRQTASPGADVPSGMIAAMGNPMAPVTAGGITVGDTGVTHTRLIPSGTAEINERLVDVVSETGYMDAGTPIRVVNVTEYRVGVEPMRERPAAPHFPAGEGPA